MYPPMGQPGMMYPPMGQPGMMGSTVQPRIFKTGFGEVQPRMMMGSTVQPGISTVQPGISTLQPGMMTGFGEVQPRMMMGSAQLQSMPQQGYVDGKLGILGPGIASPRFVTDEEIIDLKNKLNYLGNTRLGDIKRNIDELLKANKYTVLEWVKKKMYNFQDKDGKEISINHLARDILEVAKNLPANRSITCSDVRGGLTQTTDTNFIPSLQREIYSVLNPDNSPIQRFRNSLNSPHYNERIPFVNALQTAINNIMAGVDRYLQENKCPAGMFPVKVKSRNDIAIKSRVKLHKNVEAGKASATGPVLTNNGTVIHKIGREQIRNISAARKPSATGPVLTNSNSVEARKVLYDQELEQKTSATGPTMGGYRRKSRKSKSRKSRTSRKSKSKH